MNGILEMHCIASEQDDVAQTLNGAFFPYIPCTLILSKFFYSSTDEQVKCVKNNFKIYIKIDIKTAPTCFDAVTPSSGSTLFELAKVTVVKIIN
jgi:hypothetical protein